MKKMQGQFPIKQQKDQKPMNGRINLRANVNCLRGYQTSVPTHRDISNSNFNSGNFSNS